MSRRIKCALGRSTLLALVAACGVISFSAKAVDPRVITFQLATETAPETTTALIGHWRKTTIVFESPRDEHLVLHADGTAENWVVTASDRTDTTTGHWSVEGKTLTLLLGEEKVSLPFTTYEGQLVFPNIQGRRKFWERIE